MNNNNALLTVTNLVKHFDISGGLLDQLRWEGWRVVRHRTTVKAVNDVSFTIQPGEILVCPVAQPSWTAVFGLIKGVVTAQGGTLHHAAIIAREYGLPAVSNVFDAIGQIKTGQRIRVDGTQGVVYLLDK